MIEAAHRISAEVRLTDAVARLGGDEFVVLLGDVTERASAVAAAEKIEAAFAKSFVLGDARVSLGVSIGIALYPEDADDFESLLGVADAAMYRIKRVRRLRAPVSMKLRSGIPFRNGELPCNTLHLARSYRSCGGIHVQTHPVGI